jgi:hypothetical protein
MFFLANPGAKALLSQQTPSSSTSAWDEFRKDDRLRRIHNIIGEEMEMLSHVALMGDVRSSRDFVYILTTIRQALGR